MDEKTLTWHIVGVDNAEGLPFVCRRLTDAGWTIHTVLPTTQLTPLGQRISIINVLSYGHLDLVKEPDFSARPNSSSAPPVVV